LILAATVAVMPAAFAWGDNWPSFRGPGGSGIGTGSPPVRWDVQTGENVKWKRRIPGLGHSSPIVWGDRVFVTTAVSAATEAPEVKTGWLQGSGDPAADSGEWTWKVLCLDRGTGEIVWEKDAGRGVPKTKRHMKASHANSTPATDGKHVVALFGSEGLYAYDIDGHLLWKKDLGVFDSGPYDAPDLRWGFANSPVIHRDKVIVQCDALNQAFWASFRVETGEELRRVPRNEVTTWVTPAILETGAGGPTQVVCNGWKHMGGYDLESGRELWKLSGGGDCPVPTPQIAHGLIYLTNGHGRSPIYAVSPDARGDITPKEGAERPPDGLKWWLPKGGSYMPTPLILGDLLYVANDNGIITVLDARTGELRYRERLPNAGTFSASAVAADDRLYFVNEDGDVFVLQAGTSFEVLARNSMHEVCMATPAISNGELFIRGRDHLFCVGRCLDGGWTLPK
jgi:outer membrane protein assembly factor BamB